MKERDRERLSIQKVFSSSYYYYYYDELLTNSKSSFILSAIKKIKQIPEKMKTSASSASKFHLAQHFPNVTILSFQAGVELPGRNETASAATV